MNPYASYLGSQSPIPVISATPDRLKALLPSLGTRADQPIAAGKWSPRQILCHLADCEIVFAYRLRQAAAEPHHVIQPFDQDDWSKMYAAYSAEAALDVFSTVRRWNVELLKSLPAETFAKTLNHPERGDMTFHTVVETMAGHDLNHLKQIETIAARPQ